MNTKISLTQAIEGYLLAAHARHLSPNTILDYTNTYRKFIKFYNSDPPMDEISSEIIENFLANQTVSKKTILNYHTGLSALWTWAVDAGVG